MDEAVQSSLIVLAVWIAEMRDMEGVVRSVRATCSMTSSGTRAEELPDRDRSNGDDQRDPLQDRANTRRKPSDRDHLIQQLEEEAGPDHGRNAAGTAVQRNPGDRGCSHRG